MNERIKQLADEAGFMDSWFSESGDDCERELKKFAELIVRDCMDIAKNWDEQLVNSELYKESNAVGIVAYRIARQFGVKE
jgi:hypothetical protein